MPRPIALEIKLLTCLLLLAWTGCAPMFNAGINDLAVESAVHKNVVRPASRNLNEFKVDPLKFQELSTSNEPALAEDSFPIVLPNENRTKKTDLVKRQPVTAWAGIPPKKINKLIRLEPIVEAYREKPSTQGLMRLDDKSEMVSSETRHGATCEHCSGSVPVAIAPETTNGGDFVANAIPAASMTKAIPAETKTTGDNHNDFAAAGIQLSEMFIESSPPTSEPVSFVSSQMEQLVPPFANHPDDMPFEEVGDREPPLENPVVIEMQQANAASGTIPLTNESNSQPIDLAALTDDSNRVTDEPLFEQVIASSMDPNTGGSVSALVVVPSEPVATGSASHVAFSEARLTWQNQLRRTIEVFEDEIEHAPDSSDSEKLKTGLTILQALETDFNHQGMNGDGEGAESELKEYWSQQIQAINELLKHSAASNGSSPSASRALEHLHLAVNELAAVADLKLAFTAFCTKVAGFGQYTPFENSEFGSDQSVLVYCEIENFAPLLETKNGMTNYQTQLSSSFWISNDTDSIVQQQDFPAVTDNARNLRRDFFMHLPVSFANLPSGNYTLHIKVRDHGSGKIALLEQAMEFSIR